MQANSKAGSRAQIQGPGACLVQQDQGGAVFQAHNLRHHEIQLAAAQVLRHLEAELHTSKPRLGSLGWLVKVMAC